MRMAKMNNKVKKWFRLSIMAICTGIGMVQLIYAIIWAFQNGNNVQDFFDSYTMKISFLCEHTRIF